MDLDKKLESNQNSQLDGLWPYLLNDTKERPKWTAEQEGTPFDLSHHPLGLKVPNKLCLINLTGRMTPNSKGCATNALKVKKNENVWSEVPNMSLFSDSEHLKRICKVGTNTSCPSTPILTHYTPIRPCYCCTQRMMSEPGHLSCPPTRGCEWLIFNVSVDCIL